MSRNFRQSFSEALCKCRLAGNRSQLKNLHNSYSKCRIFMVKMFYIYLPIRLPMLMILSFFCSTPDSSGPWHWLNCCRWNFPVKTQKQLVHLLKRKNLSRWRSQSEADCTCSDPFSIHCPLPNHIPLEPNHIPNHVPLEPKVSWILHHYTRIKYYYTVQWLSWATDRAFGWLVDRLITSLQNPIVWFLIFGLLLLIAFLPFITWLEGLFRRYFSIIWRFQKLPNYASGVFEDSTN